MVYQRPLLTIAKTINQFLRPGQIQHEMQNFIIIEKLFQEVRSVIEALDLLIDATKYYVQWVVKAKVTQIAEIVDSRKRYYTLLHLLTIITKFGKIHWLTCC